MNVSGWTRLWIVAGALIATACEDQELQEQRRAFDGQMQRHEAPVEKKPAISVTEARLWQFKEACKDFQYNVRKDWEVQVSDPVLVGERAAIDQMKRACTDFERELWDQGMPVF